MMTHKLEKPYRCSYCNESFKYKTELLKHERAHTLDKPYNCSLCNKTFSLKSTLTNHLRTHRVKTQYQCNNCNMSFTNKKILESHLKIHTGEKSYKCNICDRVYSSYNSLIRHLGTHKEENSVNWDIKQDNLKRKRSEMFGAIKRRKTFEGIFKQSDILDGGTKSKKDLREHNLGPICIICKESWFNAFKHATGTICDRCNREKPNENECYTFSEENNMIPCSIPNELSILNDIEEASIKLIKPFLHIYKRKGGGVGFKGNCISFAQNIINYSRSLPYCVKDLPIIIIQSINTKERKFYANAKNIRNALKWLKVNHPDYKDVIINEEALKEYPENGGELIGISKIADPSKDSSDVDHQSVNDDGLLQDDEQSDMPRPDGMVFETLKRPEVSNMVKNGINDRYVDTVDWPERGERPEVTNMEKKWN